MSPSFTTGWVYNITEAPQSSNASRIIAIAVTFPALSFLACALRLYCRLFVVKAPGVDDFTALLSMVVGTAYCATSILQTRWGLGLEAEFVPTENLPQYQKIQYIGGPLYAVGVLGFKLSLLVTYHRLGGFRKLYRWTIWAVTTLATLNSIIFALVFIFSCSPVAKVWNRTLPGTCLNEVAFYFGFAGANIGIDLLVIALPFPILKGLQLDLKKKVGLGVLFGLGIFVTIVQILRLQTIAALETYTDSEKSVEWSIVEMHLGCIIACIPTYTPLLRRLGRKISRGYSGTRSRTFKSRRSGVTTVSAPDYHQSGPKGRAVTQRSSDVDGKLAEDEVALWGHKSIGQPRVWAERDAYPMKAYSQGHDSADEVCCGGESQSAACSSSVKDTGPNDITVVREIRVSDRR